MHHNDQNRSDYTIQSTNWVGKIQLNSTAIATIANKTLDLYKIAFVHKA